MKLRPHHFGQFGKKGTNEYTGSRFNLTMQKLIKPPNI